MKEVILSILSLIFLIGGMILAFKKKNVWYGGEGALCACITWILLVIGDKGNKKNNTSQNP